MKNKYQCPDCKTTLGIIIINKDSGRCTNCEFQFNLKKNQIKAPMIIAN